jgi:hypothetical protein
MNLGTRQKHVTLALCADKAAIFPVLIPLKRDCHVGCGTLGVRALKVKEEHRANSKCPHVPADVSRTSVNINNKWGTLSVLSLRGLDASLFSHQSRGKILPYNMHGLMRNAACYFQLQEIEKSKFVFVPQSSTLSQLCPVVQGICPRIVCTSVC